MRIWTANQHPHYPLDESLVEQWARWILEAVGPRDGEVSIILVDDGRIAELNRRYLNRDGPTNVLAFPMQEGEGRHITPSLLGDVVVSLDTAEREARDAGITVAARLLALIIHGILHLLGHDHVGDRPRASMMEREERRLRALVENRMRQEPRNPFDRGRGVC
jgi:probable rRNA maturation factor